MKTKLLDSLFSLFVGTLYAFALCLAVIAATVLQVAPGTLLLYCGLFVLLFNLLFFNRYTLLVSLGALLLGCVVAYISLRRQDFEAAWFLTVKGTAWELLGFFQNQLPLKPSYARITAIALTSLMSFLAALNTRVYNGFYLLVLLAAGVFAVPIYMEWGTSDLALPLMIFCFLVLLTRKLNLFTGMKNASSAAALSRYAFALIPVCLLAFGTAWLLPKPDIAQAGQRTPLDLSGMADDIIYELGPSRTMSFTESGGKLGGPISLNGQVVMEVESPEPLYLSGSVRDTYTGSAWTMSREKRTSLTPDEADRYDTSGNYPKDLFDVQRYYMRYYGRWTDEITIYTGENRTKTIFAPPFRQSLLLSDDIGLEQNNFGSIQSAKPLAKQAAYTQEYVSWDYNNIYFINVLRGAAAANGVAGLSGEDLEPYLAIPDSLPQRVRDLAHELTDGLSSDYDKLRALEAHLASFPYTFEPENVPAGEDFVDYFLFTGQEGYCVYYASSLAVMARCVDIPTRYVEGFVMPQERGDDGRYVVTNAQAHAWVEAYFQGFGWVTCEATAPYYGGGQSPPPEAQETPELTPVPPPETEQQASTPPVTPPQESDTEKPIVNQDEGGIHPLPVAALVLMVFMAAAFAAYKWITSRYAAKQQQLLGLQNREAVIAYFARIVRAASIYGYPRSKNETALTYARRVGDELEFQDQSMRMGDLAVIFSNASYSENNIHDRDKLTMKSCYSEMLQKLRASGKGRLQYYLNQYIFMRF